MRSACPVAAVIESQRLKWTSFGNPSSVEDLVVTEKPLNQVSLVVRTVPEALRSFPPHRQLSCRGPPLHRTERAE